MEEQQKRTAPQCSSVLFYFVMLFYSSVLFYTVIFDLFCSTLFLALYIHAYIYIYIYIYNRTAEWRHNSTGQRPSVVLFCSILLCCSTVLFYFIP